MSETASSRKSNIVPMDEGRLAHFRAWMEIVADEIGDAHSAVIVTMQDDTVSLRYFCCDGWDATNLAAHAQDWAAEMRAAQVHKLAK